MVDFTSDRMLGGKLFMHTKCKRHSSFFTTLSLSEEAPRRLLCVYCIEEFAKQGFSIYPLMSIDECINMKAISEVYGGLATNLTSSTLMFDTKQQELMSKTDQLLNDVKELLLKIRSEVLKTMIRLRTSHTSTPNRVVDLRERLVALLKQITSKEPEEGPELSLYCRTFAQFLNLRDKNMKQPVANALETYESCKFEVIQNRVKEFRDDIFHMYTTVFQPKSGMPVPKSTHTDSPLIMRRRGDVLSEVKLLSSKPSDLKLGHYRSLSTDRRSSKDIQTVYTLAVFVPAY